MFPDQRLGPVENKLPMSAPLSYKIDILTPADIRCFLKFFCSVDNALSQRLSLLLYPDEEHLTSLLCELIDDRASSLHRMAYGLADLNDDLFSNQSLLRASITIETTAYTKKQENRYTQSDLGIVLNYEDRIDRRSSFRKGILLQAKKLFPSNPSGYGLDSEYESFNEKQHDRLVTLLKKFSTGNHVAPEPAYNCARYLLYNPALNVLSTEEKESVLRCQTVREANQIYDFSYGLHLYNELSKEGSSASVLSNGCLVIEVKKAHRLAEEARKKLAPRSPKKIAANLAAFDLRSVIEALDIRRRALAYFLVFDFFMGGVGCVSAEFLDFVSGRNFKGDDNEQVAPPRYLLTVTLTAGSVSG